MLAHCSGSALSAVALLAGLASVACGTSDPTGSGGEGTISFTTWGEEYIEDEIPVDSKEVTGFVDGWSLNYSKFLVNFRRIEVADAKGNVAASMDGSRLFDNHVKGVKPIVTFEGVDAKAWTQVGYEIAPVTGDTELDKSATEEDRQMMEDAGYSFYAEGTATKDDVSKHFAWGFAIGTRYVDCHSEQDGKDEYGVVVTNNSEVEVQLTTHGDHLYYDRLQASPNPAIVTSLRFDTLAAADADEDDEITLEELDAAALNTKSCSENPVPCYDPSGLGAATQGAFTTSLARTIGHFRGEGECTIEAL
ncbi:MAG TPA: hypothetical protein VHP33_40665 [Polyangiaceae bacterium]|nr:hypothetical protein [Polyangiaceae bacterium]